MLRTLRIRIAARLAATAAVVLLAAHAQAADVSFAGKRITLIISSGEGGGADTYARFMAAQFERELPGKPTILSRNMVGGGGLISANWFQANAKPDGLTIYSSAPSTKLLKSFGDPGNVKFDPNKWIPVVTSPNGYVVTGSKAGKSLTMDEILAQKGRTFSIGLASVLGSSSVVLLSFELLGIDVKAAFNVPGGDAQLSFERGEYSLNSDSNGSYFRLNGKNVADGTVAPLFTYGIKDANGNIVRDPTLPNVPTLIELYRKVHGKDPSGPLWDAWLGLYEISSANSKTIMLPEGTPAEIVETYRAAAKRALTDPKVMATDAYKNLLGDAPSLFGKDAEASFVAAQKSFTPETIQFFREWMKRKHNQVI